MVRAAATASALLACMIALSVAISIDDPRCYDKFLLLPKEDPTNPQLQNEYHANGTIVKRPQTRIPLWACNAACGSGPNIYPFADIQKRLASWLLPLFVLVGSMHFVPLGTLNAFQVCLHLLGDPVDSFRCLLSTLATYQRWHVRCQTCETLAPETRKDLARIMLAYADWQEILSCGLGQPVNPSAEETVVDMINWLEECPQVPQAKRIDRLNACRAAANELADCRVAAFGKTWVGIGNYIITIIIRLVWIVCGDFNNRTGHSIAFAMLYSWIIPTAILTSMVGSFVSKHTSKSILERLQMDLVRIELDSGDRSRAAAVPQISPFNSISGGLDAAVLASMPWCGGNPLFRPRRSRLGSHSSLAMKSVAIWPTLVATCSSVIISYTSPTKGIGCRSIVQLSFCGVWLISAYLTHVILAGGSSSPSGEAGLNFTEPARHSVDGNKPSVTHPEHSWSPPARLGTNMADSRPESICRRQWHRVLAKDACVVIPQLCLLIAGFSGIFNTCFCWSAWFNLVGNAHIILNSGELIKALARVQWPVMTLVPVVLHLLFVLAIWGVYRGGVGLFSVDENERDEPRTYDVPPLDISRRGSAAPLASTLRLHP